MIKFQKLHTDAIIPTRGSPSAAGWDLYSYDDHVVPPGESQLVDTGIAMALPHGWVGLMWPRSGMAFVWDIDVHAGVIDADYRGEVSVLLFNHSNYPVFIGRGNRMAQLIVQPCCLDAEEVDSLPDSTRGSDGYGSTGV